MPLYSRDDFDKSLLPKGFKREVEDVVTVAVGVGWKLHIGRNPPSMTIISPNEEKKYHFGYSGRTSNNLNRIKRDVLRFGEPHLIAIADSVVAGKMPDDMARFVPIIDNTNTTVEEEVHSVKKAAVPTPAVMSKRKEEAVETKAATIVSEQPMIAKAGEKSGYESRTTIERQWSDGSKDYKCVDCDYTSSERGSVPSHWSKSHGSGKGRVKPEVTFAHDVPDARRYRPRQSRIDALAEVIAAAMQSGETDPEAIAKTALYWVHEQTQKGTEHSEDRVDMTPEDVLARIKALVDTPGERLETQHRIEVLEQQVQEWEALAMEQAERADRSESTLQALRELVTGEVREAAS